MLKPSRWTLLGLTAIGLICICRTQETQEDIVLRPNEEKIIHYLDPKDDADPIALLQAKIAKGQTKLDYDPKFGYLPSILRVLNIPVSSQCLVFSKTSAQVSLISPKTPRALYFGDDAYVGYVQGAKHLELSGVDPKKGAIFYSLSKGADGKPKFERELTCMRCHIGPKTAQVPGYLVRSTFCTADGSARSQRVEFVSGHTSPVSIRWGGWYVTGKSENDVHLGNSTITDERHPADMDPKPGTDVVDLKDRFDTSKYIAPTSDIVSLMLFDDSLRIHNLIIHAQYESRLAGTASGSKNSVKQACEFLLNYMTFRDEPALKGKLTGTSSIIADFEKKGPWDKKHRSLRDLDMTTRMFKYPCHYMIYSTEFDALPSEVKDYLYGRLFQIYTGKDKSKMYSTIPPDLGKETLDILLDTKPDFKAWVDRRAIIR